MSNLFPAKIGDLALVTPQHGDYQRTVVVECIHEDGRIGVFMPCFGGGGYRRPSLCYYSDQQYVIIASGWKEDLEKARQEKAEADEAARIKAGDWVRLKRDKDCGSKYHYPGNAYRVYDVSIATGVRVYISEDDYDFRPEQLEKVPVL